MDQYILEMEGINKSFNNVKVLKNVSFKLKQGEIHALVGGNGAGKSTLMKILTGVYKLDSGEIRVEGSKVSINSPNDSKKYGVGMIFQELSLIQTLTVQENIFLQNELKTSTGLMDKKTMKSKTEKLLEDLGIDVDPNAAVNTLSVGYCQLVEIAKTLSQNAKILIMDEPTASLSANETAILFEIIRKLKANGVSIIYISHRMNEIFKIADEITVLRDGENVITAESKDFNLKNIINYMIGTSTEKTFEWKDRNYQGDKSYILEVNGLSANQKVKDISFKLRKGEVLGFAGLMGSGRTEIIETIFGIRRKLKGDILVDGQKVNIKNVKNAIRSGIALVPEDRRRQGLVTMHTVKDNIALPNYSRLRNNLLIDGKKSIKMSSDCIEQLNIKTDGVNKELKLLSGGNQQKVVIAKWLKTNPKVILMDEPTAGVDIGAKGEIIDIIRKFVDTGKGVILVSSELAELLAVCDRIIVLKDGVITGEMNNKDIESEEVLQRAIQQ